jgi:hypothetical protein
VFEEGIFLGRTFSLGQVPPRRVRQLQEDVKRGRLIPFKRMMRMSLDDWAIALSGDGTRGATQYNQAWAMCHFLICATKDGEPIYRKRFLELLNRIHGGDDGYDAFTAAFSDNIDGFQTRFLEFAQSMRPTSEATMIERQDILADMLKALSGRGKSFDTIAEFRSALSEGGYRMAYQKGDVKWTTAQDPTTYFNNLTGEPLSRDEIYFERRSGSPLPDLVLRAPRQIKLRTRFHPASSGRVEHEVLIDEAAR